MEPATLGLATFQQCTLITGAKPLSACHSMMSIHSEETIYSSASRPVRHPRAQHCTRALYSTGCTTVSWPDAMPEANARITSQDWTGNTLGQPPLTASVAAILYMSMVGYFSSEQSIKLSASTFSSSGQLRGTQEPELRLGCRAVPWSCWLEQELRRTESERNSQTESWSAQHAGRSLL